MFKILFLALCLCAPYVAANTDYLSPDLRSRVNQLKAELDARPTNQTNSNARARVAWEWVNAWSRSGGYVPVDATRIISGALNTPANPVLRAFDATVKELAFFDDNPNALGQLEATTGPFTAGEFATITQTYTVGEQAIQTGGGFLLARHFMTNYGPWQNSDPSGPNYVSVTASNSKVSFLATTTPLSGMHGGFRASRETMTFRLASGTLQPGDTVNITWGDTSGGGPGMRMATFSSDRMPLPIYVALDNKGPFYSLPIQPIRVTGQSAAGVHGFAPSVVATGETFTLAIRAQDRYYNRAVGAVPNWRVQLDEQTTIAVPSTGAITKVELSLPAAGIYRPSISSEDGSIVGITNPIQVKDEVADRIYWGDTHGHSGFAEGIGTPERFMVWARDDASLDYVTHSEHDIWLDDAEWEVLRKHVKDFTVDGEFVAYLGYEWTVGTRNGGHHNVLFRNPDHRQRISSHFFPTLTSLYTGLRNAANNRDVVVIPHAHQAGNYRISDPALEPLIEIMSQHGNFEWFGRMYLKHGHQVGFTAASDNHLSQPGYSAPQGGSLSQRGGLGAIMATEKTVDAIFDGMKELSSYATTGDRIILNFSLNGEDMGQRTPYDPNREIKLAVHGTAPIDTITVVKNDQVLWQKQYLELENNRSSRTGTYLLSFQSESEPQHRGDNPRGWRAWEGTLKVLDGTIEEITPQDASFPLQVIDTSELADGNVRFATKTRGDTSSYLVRLSGITRNTRMQFDLIETRETGGAPPIYRPQQRPAADSFAFNLRDMEDNRISHQQQVDYYTDTVTLRRISTEGTMDVEETINDQGNRHGDYYYVRVVQANDAIAWSSPIWVGGHPPR